MAVWGLVLTELDEDDHLDYDTPKEKQRRRVYPRPDYNASVWDTMLRGEHCLDHATRTARFVRRRFNVIRSISVLLFFISSGACVESCRPFLKYRQKSVQGCIGQSGGRI